MESPTKQSEPQDDRAKKIEDLLEKADKLIGSGEYDGAFELIRRAQSLDAEHKYSLAFVGRIQRLMTARKGRPGSSTAKPGSQYAPQSFLNPDATGEKKKAGADAKSQSAPTQKSKSSGSAPGQAPVEKGASGKMDAGGSRQAAMHTAIQGFLARAQEYRAGRNFARALAEIDRALFLDPGSSEAAELSAAIKKEMEEDRARMTEEQRRKVEEEEKRKRDAVEQEIARIRKEKEEKKQKEDEARKNAQRQRIEHYLAVAKEFIDAGKLEEAANQLAFVTVIDPMNAGAAELQRRIREIQEQRRQEEAERRRKQEEEEQQRAVAVKTAIQKNIETATALAAEKKFNDALRVVTRAYMLDPLNEDVRACEQQILQAQEEAYRLAEEERRVAEVAARKQQEDELRRLTELERDRLLKEQDAALEQEKKLAKEKVQRFLIKAREHINNKAYHDALGEVAQAFAIDPFDEDVQKIEQEITVAQKHDLEAAPAEEQAAPAEESENLDRQVEGLLESAKKLRTQGEYARALDELTKAFVIDPLNDSVRSLEAEVEAQIREAERLTSTVTEAPPEPPAAPEPSAPAAVPPPLPVPPSRASDTQKVTFHVMQARKLRDEGATEDALAEVGLGLIIDPNNAELQQLEAELWQIANGAAGQAEEAEGKDTERLINIHLAAAEQFQEKGEFVRALDEIAKAYQIDPLNQEIKKREIQIRQEEARRARPDETPLKLVYPKKGAAGGMN